MKKRANMTDIHKMSDSSLSENDFKEIVYEYLRLSAKSMIEDNYAFRFFCGGYIQVFQFKARKSNVYFVKNGERKIQMKGSPYFAFKWIKGTCPGAWKYFSYKPYSDRYSQKLGNRGLSKHINKLHKDPYSRDYSAPPLSK